MKRIYEPDFQYTPSFATDVSKTFERVRRQYAERTKAKPEPIKLDERRAERQAVDRGQASARS